MLLLLLLRLRWGRVVIVGVSMTAWGRREIFLGGRHLVPLLPLVISLSSSCCAVQLSHKCSCWLDIPFTREPCCVVVGCGKLRELGQHSKCARECLESE